MTALFVLHEGNALPPGSVQILHVDGNHWLTVPTTDLGFDVTVYESMKFTLNESTKPNCSKQPRNNYMCALLIPKNRLDLISVVCLLLLPTAQHLFMVTTLVTTSMNKDLREHYLEGGTVRPFPVIRPMG